MIIQEIIAIAGKPGLYRILVTNRSNLVVESMLDRKRLSIPGTSRISSLADITMYTTGEDVLLMDVLNRMNEHVGSNDAPNVRATHKPRGILWMKSFPNSIMSACTIRTSKNWSSGSPF